MMILEDLSSRGLTNHKGFRTGGEKVIYENILARCKKEGISISALEAKCGLGNATIRGWEKSNPRVDRIKPVADYFGVTIDELIKEADNAESSTDR